MSSWLTSRPCSATRARAASRMRRRLRSASRRRGRDGVCGGTTHPTVPKKRRGFSASARYGRRRSGEASQLHPHRTGAPAMTSSISARPQSTSAARVVLGLLAAAVVALIGNTLIALAVSALRPGGVVKGLTFLEYGSLTVVGVLVGTAGWALVRRSARRPRAVLRWLAPVVVVLTFGADLGLLA